MASTDPKKLPVAWKERGQRDIEHHQREWTSGARGGGTVPATFRWPTNPKQRQEELGASQLVRPQAPSSTPQAPVTSGPGTKPPA